MSSPVSAPPATPPVAVPSGNDFQSTVVDLLGQLIAAVLACAENLRLGPVPGGTPFDKTTMAYKDINLETSVSFKEYYGFVIAGNHPAGLIDPQWAGGFPLWPIFVSSGGVSGGTGSALAPIKQALSSVPTSQVQSFLGGLPAALAPLLASNPAMAAAIPLLLPLIGSLVGGIGAAAPAGSAAAPTGP